MYSVCGLSGGLAEVASVLYPKAQFPHRPRAEDQWVHGLFDHSFRGRLPDSSGIYYVGLLSELPEIHASIMQQEIIVTGYTMVK